MPRTPRILLFDIETAPTLGWVWETYQTNVIAIEKEWYMVSFAAKWLGEKETRTYALPDYKGYRKNPEHDKELIKELWRLFNEADILIAHNGDEFDVKKANARFAYHNLPPPAPYKTIDTLKIARKYFKFTSNRLDDLGNHLGVGRKMVHTGFHLWQGCMRGDAEAWKMMRKYNRQDVILLERIYLHLRPWASLHPNLGAYVESVACPKCGSHNLVSRGTAITLLHKYRRFQCKNCGGWAKENTRISSTKPLVNL